MDLFAGRDFAACLFDLDGTLISSEPVVQRSWTIVFREFAFPPGATVQHGVPARAMIDDYLRGRPQEERDAAFARILDLEEHDTEGLEVLPGAYEALRALGASGRCAIVTSCTRHLAEVRLTASRLPPPDRVVTADDVTRGKPDPMPFVAGATALGVPAARCLVVEDAPAGIAAARAAGAAVLAVTTTHPATALPADVVVSSLASVQFVPGPHGVRVIDATAD